MKHEGILYPCTECDYAARTVANLKPHKRIKNENKVDWASNSIIPQSVDAEETIRK